jgi:hypothetical protein
MWPIVFCVLIIIIRQEEVEEKEEEGGRMMSDDVRDGARGDFTSTDGWEYIR